MSRFKRYPLIGMVMVGLLQCGCQDPNATAPERLREEPISLVNVRDDFEMAVPGDSWSFLNPGLWRVGVEGHRRFLQMAYPPDLPPQGGPQRPSEYAMFNAYQFRSFALTCRLRVDSAPRDEGNNACVIFGWRDDRHFYYVHLSNVYGELSNTVVRVEGGTARSLIPLIDRREPAFTDQDWHKVDVLRDANTGSIEVYVNAFSEDAQPLFSVTDRTYEWGHIGFGACRDHASFAGVEFEGEARRSGLPPLLTTFSSHSADLP